MTTHKEMTAEELAAQRDRHCACTMVSGWSPGDPEPMPCVRCRLLSHIAAQEAEIGELVASIRHGVESGVHTDECAWTKLPLTREPHHHPGQVCWPTPGSESVCDCWISSAAALLAKHNETTEKD